MIKEIVVINQGTVYSSQFTGIFSTNSVSNDLLDLEPGWSVRLVWVTAAGGWVVLSTCETLGAFWD